MLLLLKSVMIHDFTYKYRGQNKNVHHVVMLSNQ